MQTKDIGTYVPKETLQNSSCNYSVYSLAQTLQNRTDASKRDQRWVLPKLSGVVKISNISKVLIGKKITGINCDTYRRWT